MTVIWLQRIAMAIILTAAFLFLKNSQMEENETRKSNRLMGIKNSDSYDFDLMTLMLSLTSGWSG